MYLPHLSSVLGAGEYSCHCGAVSGKRLCRERDFQCGRVCGRTLACGRHVCERVCHAGKCAECPHAGVRTCPCGKVNLAPGPVFLGPKIKTQVISHSCLALCLILFDEVHVGGWQLTSSRPPGHHPAQRQTAVTTLNTL